MDMCARMNWFHVISFIAYMCVYVCMDVYEYELAREFPSKWSILVENNIYENSGNFCFLIIEYGLVAKK